MQIARFVTDLERRFINQVDERAGHCLTVYGPTWIIPMRRPRLNRQTFQAYNFRLSKPDPFRGQNSRIRIKAPSPDGRTRLL